MNKRIAVVAAGALTGVLVLSGCANTSYEYEVSGTVEAGQIDYDCPDGAAMDTVVFIAKSKPGGSGTSGSSGKTAKKPSTSTGSNKTADKDSTPSKSTPTTPVKKPSGKGVKLSEKPDKAERVSKVPKVQHPANLSGCETEYELFVKNADGLFEQDVRKVDYDKCTDSGRESFPSCTKN